jgi:hypothetical protein
MEKDIGIGIHVNPCWHVSGGHCIMLTHLYSTLYSFKCNSQPQPLLLNVVSVYMCVVIVVVRVKIKVERVLWIKMRRVI